MESNKRPVGVFGADRNEVWALIESLSDGSPVLCMFCGRVVTPETVAAANSPAGDGKVTMDDLHVCCNAPECVNELSDLMDSEGAPHVAASLRGASGADEEEPTDVFSLGWEPGQAVIGAVPPFVGNYGFFRVLGRGGYVVSSAPEIEMGFHSLFYARVSIFDFEEGGNDPKAMGTVFASEFPFYTRDAWGRMRPNPNLVSHFSIEEAREFLRKTHPIVLRYNAESMNLFAGVCSPNSASDSWHSALKDKIVSLCGQSGMSPGRLLSEAPSIMAHYICPVHALCGLADYLFDTARLYIKLTSFGEEGVGVPPQLPLPMKEALEEFSGISDALAEGGWALRSFLQGESFEPSSPEVVIFEYIPALLDKLGVELVWKESGKSVLL